LPSNEHFVLDKNSPVYKGIQRDMALYDFTCQGFWLFSAFLYGSKRKAQNVSDTYFQITAMYSKVTFNSHVF